MKKYTILLFAAICLFSCRKQDVIDMELIEEYLATNNIEAEMLASGLYFKIDEPGNDEHPDINSDLTVHYEGSTLDGNVFDSSLDGDPVNFYLYQVIEGWQQGLPLFGKGGKGYLYIPSDLAYGNSSPSPDIGKNEVLIFYIHLIDFL